MRRFWMEKGPGWVRQLLDWMEWVGERASWPQRGMYPRTVIVSSSKLESSGEDSKLESVGDPDPVSSLWVTYCN